MARLPRELLEGLPEEDDEAFILVEEYARAEWRDRLRELTENESSEDAEMEYMERVLGAAVQYEIDALKSWMLPNVTDGKVVQLCRQFRSEVGHVVVQLQLNTQRRERKLSVRLDVPDKTKLRRLLDQMRQVIDDADLTVGKKERLRARIHDLQQEIDRDRTRLAQVGALIAEVMTIAKECEPALRIGERIAAACGYSKEKEDDKRLSAPPAKKQIEPPKVETPKKKSSFDSDLDDEIPF